MSPELLPRLRRFWWAPLAFLLIMDLAWPFVLRSAMTLNPGMGQSLGWLPVGLTAAAEIALVSLVWLELPEGGPEQILLGCQAALPLLWGLAGRFWLFPRLGGMQGSGMQFWLAWRFGRTLVEGGFLVGAFHLRRREPESGALAVTASAGLAILGGGWDGLGLASLLALLWKDPLPAELCGAEVDREAASARASLTGFLMLLAAPVLMVLPALVWGMHAFSYGFEWVVGPALLVGALSWTLIGARLGRGGKLWRVLSWVALGLVPLLGIALIVILLSMNGGRLF